MTDTAGQQSGGDEGAEGQERSWLQADVDGRPLRFWIVVGLVIAVVTLGFGVWWIYGLDRGGQIPGAMAGQQTDDQQMTDQPVGDQQMDDMAMSPDAPRLPAVFGYYDGEPIAFVHPEVSDPAIAQVLEGMMGSPVLVVPSLADVPETARGAVYVFANGVVPEDTPAGPLGFQPDVFDSAPGDEDYTPLREIVQVTWNDETQAELLTTMEEIQAAEQDGLLKLERTGVVVNAPFLTWPGGQR